MTSERPSREQLLHRLYEAAELVNLIGIREGGPYAVRADIRFDGEGGFYRATLCRCGGSATKPFCDGTHAKIGFRSDNP